jgi:very-short-patch-repair endonuclease
MSFPALIPEVWLNYLGPQKSADDEIHLSENPSRVDFVMIAEGKKCVIEIDGKSHYADYDEEARRWSVSERRYTRNLRIERSLRNQGWEIFRFSDLEVNACTDAQFPRLVEHLPGMKLGL